MKTSGDERAERYEQWTTIELIAALYTLPPDWIWRVRVPCSDTDTPEIERDGSLLESGDKDKSPKYREASAGEGGG